VFDGGNFKDTRRPLTKFLFDAISVASRECHVTQTLKKDGGKGGVFGCGSPRLVSRRINEDNRNEKKIDNTKKMSPGQIKLDS
jgi:hypothetical protein